MRKKDNIILIGMPASGKSTIGVVLAKKLGFDFVDTDLSIQKQEKKLLRDIIDERGINGFLKIENQVNKEVDVQSSVISPGGSVIYCKEAMEHYKGIGRIIYLQVSYDEIEKRLADAKNRGVILREGQSLKELYNERVPLFEAYANITIKQDGLTIGESIEAVIDALQT